MWLALLIEIGWYDWIPYALHQAPRLTTLPVEKAVFDQTTKRLVTLLKVHVHGIAVYIPGNAPLICSAVDLEARAIQGNGWVLVSNLHLPEDDGAARATLAIRLVQAYRQRWAIEDGFAWTKGVLKWESARVLHFEGFRVLVNCAWIVAAFLFELGTRLDDRQLRLVRTWVPGDGKKNTHLASGCRPGVWNVWRSSSLCKSSAQILSVDLWSSFLSPATSSVVQPCTESK